MQWHWHENDLTLFLLVHFPSRSDAMPTDDDSCYDSEDASSEDTQNDAYTQQTVGAVPCWTGTRLRDVLAAVTDFLPKYVLRGISSRYRKLLLVSKDVHMFTTRAGFFRSFKIRLGVDAPLHPTKQADMMRHSRLKKLTLGITATPSETAL